MQHSLYLRKNGEWEEINKKLKIQVTNFKKRIDVPPYLTVKTNDKGLAIYTNKPIEKGTFIGKYDGKRYTKRQYAKIKDKSKMFGIWQFKSRQAQQEQDMSKIEYFEYIDGNNGGNFTALVNHNSERPNIETRQVYNKDAKKYEIHLYTSKNISKNTELMFDYADEPVDDSKIDKLVIENGNLTYRNNGRLFVKSNEDFFPISLQTLQKIRLSEQKNLSASSVNLKKLHKHLYIGNIEEAQNKIGMTDWNVICLTPQCGDLEQAYYKNINIKDSKAMTKQEFVNHMDDVYPKIQESLKSGKKTLVNCRAGINRSAAAIAYWASIFVLPTSSTFMNMSSIIEYIREQNKIRQLPALTNSTFENFLNDTTARVINIPNIPTGKQKCAGLVLNTTVNNTKDGLTFSEIYHIQNLKTKAERLYKQLQNKVENWNKMGNRFEHSLEQITEDFDDTTSVNEIKKLRKFIVNIVPDLRGATFIDEMTYVRYKNELYANTDPHIDYKNVVEERQLISKEDAHRVRTVWVPLHDLYGKQSVLTFTAKKRNRKRKQKQAIFESGDIVIFGLKVKHMATKQKSNDWRISLDFRVLLPKSDDANGIYYNGITERVTNKSLRSTGIR